MISKFCLKLYKYLFPEIRVQVTEFKIEFINNYLSFRLKLLFLFNFKAISITYI